MRNLPIIVVASVLALLGVGCSVLYAYDSGRADLIADGVRVGSIDVGGLRADAARERVRAGLLGPLREPLVVRAGDERFELGAREARIRANVATMVSDAVARSREGSFIGRTWRELTGGDVQTAVTPAVDFSMDAVQRLVDRVRVSATREAVDANVGFSSTSVSVRESQTGRTVDAKRLKDRLLKAIVTPGKGREVRAKIVRTQPEVSTENVAARYPVVLVVDRGAFRIRLFKGLKESKSYPIALGEAGQETPSGLYSIQNKAVNPAWNVPNSDWAGDLAGQVIPGGAPDNPLKSRWMGVYDGVGVHGTADRGSIGSNASKGCIRMLVEDVEALYDEVPVGAPIYIA